MHAVLNTKPIVSKQDHPRQKELLLRQGKDGYHRPKEVQVHRVFGRT